MKEWMNEWMRWVVLTSSKKSETAVYSFSFTWMDSGLHLVSVSTFKFLKCANKWINGWMNGWMDGWMNETTNEYIWLGGLGLEI